MKGKSILQTMAAKMNENHRQNTDYIKCQSSFILVSYWLKEDHVIHTKFNY